MNILDFVKSELKNFNLELNVKIDGRKGVDFLIGTNQISLQSINLNTERSIKIPKQELGEIRDNLWVILVLIIENEPRGLYVIPSKKLSKPDNYIFIDNEMAFKPLSNYEIKVFRSAFEELSQFSIENMIKSILT